MARRGGSSPKRRSRSCRLPPGGSSGRCSRQNSWKGLVYAFLAGGAAAEARRRRLFLMPTVAPAATGRTTGTSVQRLVLPAPGVCRAGSQHVLLLGHRQVGRSTRRRPGGSRAGTRARPASCNTWRVGRFTLGLRVATRWRVVCRAGSQRDLLLGHRQVGSAARRRARRERGRGRRYFSERHGIGGQ